MREVKIDFAALISPMRKEEFFADFWQKQPLVQSSNTPGRFAELFINRRYRLFGFVPAAFRRQLAQADQGGEGITC
ncbi:MAG TPA: hypothetical protein VKB05_06720 [Pyrinomonadaceae bacterium]|nr:hypothetical protein [Pyrinomonadaceae bacterium]